jgi:glycosyltransferase involved in cell wall biosynthesis
MGRLTLGLPFELHEHWTGGVYYVRNLVCALGLLPAGRRPRLIVLGDDPRALAYLKTETSYPGLRMVEAGVLSRADATRLPFGLGRDPREVDAILLGGPPGLEDRAIQWVPDFQEKRFPEFFPPSEVEARFVRNTDWFSRHRHVMVSSQDVKADLARFYGAHANEVHVTPFASFVERDLASVDAGEVRARYGLPGRYFICTNQFWAHKNHRVLIEALGRIPADRDLPPVVLTGKEQDYRDPDYAPSVRRLAAELGVEHRLRFLGFIPRADQLSLSQDAVCVIQPSLCEGWSTVVEDAKAMGRHVLASDIAVHREQLETRADFFAPHDAGALAALIERYADRDPAPGPIDYAAAKQAYAEALMAMAEDAVRDFRRRRVPRVLAPA